MTLQKLQDCDFVVIGGYAVNAYTLPRFSIDCDIVVKNKEKLQKIEEILERQRYQAVNSVRKALYTGDFKRYEKRLEQAFKVSMDIMIENVTDRLTGAIFNAAWIFQHSHRGLLKGKTISEELRIRIINLDALLVMKITSCRPTDIRDVFMMLPKAANKEWIQTEVAQRCDFRERLSKIMILVNSRQFQNGLAGVYGYLDKKLFEKHQEAVRKLSS